MDESDFSAVPWKSTAGGSAAWCSICTCCVECPCAARMRLPSSETVNRFLSLVATISISTSRVMQRPVRLWRLAFANRSSMSAQPFLSSVKPICSGRWRKIRLKNLLTDLRCCSFNSLFCIILFHTHRFQTALGSSKAATAPATADKGGMVVIASMTDHG